MNDEEGNYFVGAGDRLAYSAGGSVSVGIDDPATAFYQKLWFTNSSGTVSSTMDSVFVQPDNVGNTLDDLEYPVPAVHENSYTAHTELYYYDEASMKVRLGYAFDTFTSD